MNLIKSQINPLLKVAAVLRLSLAFVLPFSLPVGERLRINLSQLFQFLFLFWVAVHLLLRILLPMQFHLLPLLLIWTIFTATIVIKRLSLQNNVNLLVLLMLNVVHSVSSLLIHQLLIQLRKVILKKPRLNGTHKRSGGNVRSSANPIVFPCQRDVRFSELPFVRFLRSSGFVL